MKKLITYKTFESNRWLNEHYNKLDEIYQNGGFIYRIIYSENKKIDFSNIHKGHHWTYNKDLIYETINVSMAQFFQDDYTLKHNNNINEFYGWLITAKIYKYAFDLEYSKEIAMKEELELYFEEEDYDNIKVTKVERFLLSDNDYSLNKDENYKIYTRS